MTDNVNSPLHYQGKVECIDCLESATEGWNDITDLHKCLWYVNHLIEKLENELSQH